VERNVLDPKWQKSSYSSGDVNQDCVEVAGAQDGRLHIREGDDPGTVLTATPARLAALLRHVRRRLPTAEQP
jgi:hypothetical protein